MLHVNNSMNNDNHIKVFISYSHVDKAWLDRLRVHLTPLKQEHEVDIWEDTRLKPGSKWRSDIRSAIEKANVAILIISADFLASEFIRTNELPPLLKAAEEEGVLILPIIASPSLFSLTPSISQFQAVNNPSEPLVSLNIGQQEEVFLRVAIQILERANSHKKEISEEQLSVAKRESFLETETWLRLIKIGDWIYDQHQKRVVGSGIQAYLLSREEYGSKPFTIKTSLQFSNFRQYTSEMNAGIILGWNSDKANPRYYNILLTGKRLLIEQIGFNGGEAYRDFQHISEEVSFPIDEDIVYDLTLSVSDSLIDIFVEGQRLLSLMRSTGMVGRVGLRPWRSQMECTSFIVSELQ